MQAQQERDNLSKVSVTHAKRKQSMFESRISACRHKEGRSSEHVGTE